MGLQGLADVATRDGVEEVRGIHVQDNEVIGLAPPIGSVSSSAAAWIPSSDEAMGVPVHRDVFQLSEDRSLKTFGLSIGSADNPQSPELHDSGCCCLDFGFLSLPGIVAQSVHPDRLHQSIDPGLNVFV